MPGRWILPPDISAAYGSAEVTEFDARDEKAVDEHARAAGVQVAAEKFTAEARTAGLADVPEARRPATGRKR